MCVNLSGVQIPPELTAVKSIRMNEAKMIINPRTKEIEEHAPDTVVIQTTYLNNFWVVGSPDGTYGYYDENNQCLGYAQKRLFENENLEREYYLVFMDADGNLKDYLAEERGEELYDYEGNQIGSGKAELKGYIGEKCYFEIDTETGVSVDAVDKMAMYLQLFSKFNETAGD